MGQRLTICKYFIAKGYPVYKVLQYAGVASSTWYDCCNKDSYDKRHDNKGRPKLGYSYDLHGNKVADYKIVEILHSYRNEEYFANAGGYRKFKHYLLREFGIKINHKKLYRLCKENKILLPRFKKKRFIRNICTNRVITRPNQLWEFDIKYGHVHGQGKFFFLLAYIDVYSRKVIDYYLGLTCKGHNLSATLSFAIKKAGIRVEDDLVIRSDNGTQMRCNAFRDYLSSLQDLVQHEYIPIATPNKNAHIESFFSIIERECLWINYFSDIADVYKKIGNFINFYNVRRVHGSLGYRAPDEVMRAYANGDDLGKVIKTSV